MCAKLSADREFGKVMTVRNPGLDQNMPKHHHVKPQPLFTGVYAHDMKRRKIGLLSKPSTEFIEPKCLPKASVHN